MKEIMTPIQPQAAQRNVRPTVKSIGQDGLPGSSQSDQQALNQPTVEYTSQLPDCQGNGRPSGLGLAISYASRVVKKLFILEPTDLLPEMNQHEEGPKIAVKLFSWAQKEKFLKAVGAERLSSDRGFITAILLAVCDEKGNNFFTPLLTQANGQPFPEGSIPFTEEEIDYVKNMETPVSSEIFEQAMILNGFYKGDNEIAKNSGKTST